MRTWQGRARRGFSPHDVAESKFWFDPGRGVTNVGGAASQWVDVIGGYAAAQGSAPARPTIATGINGRASLSFDSAASQELTNTADDPITAGNSRYVVLVASCVVSNGGGLFKFRSGTTLGWNCLAVNLGLFYYFTNGVVNSNDSVGAPTITSPFVIEYELVKSQVPVVRINGTARSITGSLSSADDAGDSGFKIASSNAGIPFWAGHIGDVYCASALPSATDVAKLRTFFASKNGITL